MNKRKVSDKKIPPPPIWKLGGGMIKEKMNK